MFFIISIIGFALLLAYSALIILYRKWFTELKPFDVYRNVEATMRFSVIIPARNEEAVIVKCLQTILQQNYPSDFFEVIVVDDHSTDKTSDIIKKLQLQYSNLHLLDLATALQGQNINSYKKKGIETAIAQSKYEWVVTTDADCFVHENWLYNLNDFILRKNSVFVAAPVMFTNEKNFISLFQIADFISLQGITAASVSAGIHSMCNGANLAYEKAAFYKVNGFKGIDNIASGDDMLLMHKIKKAFPNKLGYLFHKDSIVYTLPMPDWKSFFNQRIRWASKANNYDDKTIFTVLLLVYIFNLFIFILPLLSFFNIQFLLLYVAIILLKSLVELSFMISVADFFGYKKLMRWFIFLQPIHVFYTVIAGWLGIFGSYNWKGRNVK